MSDLYAVEFLPNLRITLRDGVELSANLWRPAARQPGERFPAVLEYIPYRKDDWRFQTDAARLTYLAERGFAGCRVDIRGTGSSQGLALDEYTEAETLDGLDVIAWLAAQPWCNGAVGMWGISYGGFTAIQLAMRRPPALKAIAPMYATDDRYQTDVHYNGGNRTASDLAQYAVGMVAMNALPPKAEYAGADWAALWKARLEQTPPWVLNWLRHQTDGPYWRHNSLAPDYDQITIPILHFAGWADGYRDAALRMQARCPTQKLIVGPWAHIPPESAWPGPTIDWLDELTRFFDRYLKGVENGWETTPAVRAFVETSTPPEAFPAQKNGVWRAEAAFPAPGTRPQTLYLGAGRLAPEPPIAAEAVRYPHRPEWGTAGPLCSGAGSPPNGLARDLRPDEALVPAFTSAPLAEPLEILGFPELTVAFSCTAPAAALVARLADVHPDGTSALVTWGALNLTHRAGHTDPQPLTPGEVYTVTVTLSACAYRFPAGHRLRLSLGSAHWPLLWPTPFPAENTLHLSPAAPAALTLPAVPPASLPVPVFKTTPPDLRYPGGGHTAPAVWRISDDPIADTVTVSTFQGDTTLLPDGLEVATDEALEMSVGRRDPAHARLSNVCHYRLRQRGYETEVRSAGTFRSTAGEFHVDIQLTVTLNGSVFFQKAWLESVPRNGV